MTKNLTKTKLQTLVNNITSFSQGDIESTVKQIESVLMANSVDYGFELWGYEVQPFEGHNSEAARLVLTNFTILWVYKLNKDDTVGYTAIVYKEG